MEYLPFGVKEIKKTGNCTVVCKYRLYLTTRKHRISHRFLSATHNYNIHLCHYEVYFHFTDKRSQREKNHVKNF